MSAIGSASNASAQLASQVSVSVAGKVQDAAKAEGQAVLSLLQDAAEIAKQGSTEAGKGVKIDVHA